MVATEGWLESSDVEDSTLMLEMLSVGVWYFIVTDISKDGTLSGVNLKQLETLQIAAKGNCNIIASGGVHTIEDIYNCKALGLYGTICGKSIYKGTLDLQEAITVAERGA
jgi:phosphoribosylformimino-5-aminoimidazole carboxamide ribotide isomerase